jgi:hypothetical protein
MPPDMSEILSEYFTTIEHSLEETLVSQKRTDLLQFFGIVNVFIFIFSVFPFLPYLLTSAIPSLMKANFVLVRVIEYRSHLSGSGGQYVQ